MSYRIVFKGGMGDEFVEDYIGREMANDFESGKLTGMVNINGNIYDSKSVKAIMSGFSNPDTSDKKEELVKMARDIRSEFEDMKVKQLRLTPKERAQSALNLALADMMFLALTGHKMTENDMVEVIEKSEKWLTERPEFHAANPTCYLTKKDILFKDKGESEAQHISILLQRSAIQFAERFLAA